MEEKIKRLLGQRVWILHSRGYAHGILTRMDSDVVVQTYGPNEITDAAFRFTYAEIRDIDHDEEPDIGGTINIWLTI